MSKRNISLFSFAIFWLVSFAFYFKTAGAGFVTDEIGWFQNYQATGWEGVFRAFGDKSLHYVYHLVGFLAWKSLGLNGFAWMMAFILLHVAIATISFNVFSELFLAEGIPYSSGIAFTGGLLFVISPYQTESLVWYACVHYLVCSLLLLVVFFFLLKYLRQDDKKFIVAIYICFSLSLFTLEISFSFPIILFLFFLFWPSKIFKDVSRFRLIKIFVLPSFGLLIIYFLLSKIFRGSIVGHYGASQHLNFDIPLLMGNFGKYFSKIFFFTQFISYEQRHTLYLAFEREEVGWLLLFVLCIVVLLCIVFNKKLNGRFRILLILFVFFAITLLPILNLYFSYIVNIEGDRFTYFASLFAYQFIALGSVLLFRKFGWVLLAIFTFFSLKFLFLNTESWKNSEIIQNSLIEKFRWYDAEKIYLLNVPDNFRGAYMFRSFPPDNFFSRTLSAKKGKSVEEKLFGILEYNMNSISDSVKIEKVANNELKVIFAQPGNWWWNNGIGASDYSTKDYSVRVDEWGFSYNILFTNKIPNAVYLYQCGVEWREVKDF